MTCHLSDCAVLPVHLGIHCTAVLHRSVHYRTQEIYSLLDWFQHQSSAVLLCREIAKKKSVNLYNFNGFKCLSVKNMLIIT